MFCEKCGAQISAGMKFCMNCGAPVSAVPPQQGAPAPVNDGGRGAVNDLMNSYYRAAQGMQQPSGAPVQGAPVQPGAQFQGYPGGAPVQNAGIPVQGAEFPQGAPQQAGVMPEAYSAYPQAVKPIKKRGKFRKFLPAACIAGGVAVLAGTGLIVYNCNKAFFTHSALGDAGYAHEMIVGTLTSGKTGEMLNKSLRASGTMAKAQNAAYQLYHDTDYGTYIAYKDFIMLEAYAQIMQDYYGTSSVQMTVSADVDLNSDGRDAIESILGGYSGDLDIDEVLKSVSDLKLTTAGKYENGVAEGAASLNIGSDTIVAAQVRCEKDGTYTMILPGISDIGIKGELPVADYGIADVGKTSTYDFSALEQKIRQRTKPLFSSYKYKYSTGSEYVKGVEFNGMKVEITLGVDDVYELCNVVLDVMANDSQFVNYMAEISGTDADDIVSQFERTISSNESYLEYYSDYSDGGSDFKVTMYVNNDNSLAGAGLKIGTSNIVYISNGVDAAFSLKSGETEYIRFAAEGKSASEGTAKLTFNDGYSAAQTFTVNYRNFGVMTAFGNPCIKGDFEMTLDDQTLYNMDSSLRSLSGAKLLLSIAPNGNGMKISAGISHDDYGKAVLNCAIDAAGTVAPKPGNNYNMCDPDDNDSLSKINSDLMDHMEKLADKYPVIDSVYSPIVKGYVDSDRVMSANSTAASIKNNTGTFLTIADTQGYGMKMIGYDVDSLDITITDGKWYCTSADPDLYRSNGNVSWGGGAYAVGAGDSKVGVTSAETLLCIELADLFPTIRNGVAHIELNSGSCTAVAFTEDQKYLVEGTDMPYIYEGYFQTSFGWNGKTAGITSSGAVVGTAPAIPLDSYYDY